MRPHQAVCHAVANMPLEPPAVRRRRRRCGRPRHPRLQHGQPTRGFGMEPGCRSQGASWIHIGHICSRTSIWCAYGVVVRARPTAGAGASVRVRARVRVRSASARPLRSGHLLRSSIHLFHLMPTWCPSSLHTCLCQGSSPQRQPIGTGCWGLLKGHWASMAGGGCYWITIAMQASQNQSQLGLNQQT